MRLPERSQTTPYYATPPPELSGSCATRRTVATFRPLSCALVDNFVTDNI
jgi:hypothetical protein